MIRQNLLSAYPKQVHLYFKTFPLDMHPWAKPAAVAGLCVNRQKADLFWEYHDWIFAHQSEITPENLKDKVMEWAKGQKDLDSLQLTSCVTSNATLPEVEKNIASFVNAGGVGINLEDGRWPHELHLRKIEAALKAGERTGVKIFINARTDVFLKQLVPAEQATEETLKRAKAIKAAGASGLTGKTRSARSARKSVR